MRRWFSSAGAALPLALFAGLLAPTPAPAETCLSPFVKRLDRPEKYLYVFCVDADAKDNDFLAVIDVDAESARYGKILHQLDLGSAGQRDAPLRLHRRPHATSGAAACSPTASSSSTWPTTRPGRSWSRRFDSSEKTGFTGPHSPYALPGRMLISFLGGKDGGLPAGLAEFTNDGTVHPQARPAQGSPLRLRRGHQARHEPHGHVELHAAGQLPEAAGQDGPEALRQQAGGLGLPRPQAAADADDRGGAAGVPLVAQGGGRPRLHQLRPRRLDLGLGRRRQGSLQRPQALRDGQAARRPRQSPDGKYLYVSCFASDEVQQWDVSDLKKPKLTSTLKPGEQPNMMHVTGDGKRMYITNSLLSTMDRSDKFWVRLAQVGPDGLKMDPKFDVDLTKFPTGPARGHDMLLH